MSINCPKCKAKAKCVDSRLRDGPFVYRRYRCKACECRFSTAEVMVTIDGEQAPAVKRYGSGAYSVVDKLETQAFQRGQI